MTHEGLLLAGQVAHEVGVNVETLRYYERRGLLPSPRRAVSGYRVYDADAVGRLRGIKRAKELGFTLKEIRQLIALRSRRRSRADVVSLLAGKMRDIDDKIRALRLLRGALEQGAATCKCGGDLSRCDVLGELGADAGSGDAET